MSAISNSQTTSSAAPQHSNSTYTPKLFKNKPAYKKLIIKALATSPRGLHTKKGTSAQYIKSFIKQRYVTPNAKTLNKFVNKRLKELLQEGKIVQVKRSFRFSAQMKKEMGALPSKRISSKGLTKSTKMRTARKSAPRTSASKKSGLKTATKHASRTAAWTISSGCSSLPSNNFSVSNITAPASGWIWQYYHDGFHDYSIVASEVVEQNYQEYLHDQGKWDVRSVESGTEGWSYMIDYTQMTQQNIKHEAHTVRRIRRVQWTGPSL